MLWEIIKIMKKVLFKIKENREISENIYKMVLSGDTEEINKAGQFLDLKLSNYYLRRPISVSDFDDNSVTIVYKVLGKGTKFMTMLPRGHMIDALTGLGNGFDESKSGPSPLLIGGGVGIPPLLKLAKMFNEINVNPSIALGFNSEKDAFYIDEFKELSSKVSVASVDGSIGVKGFVTDICRDLMPSSFVYTCGPLSMLKSVYSFCEKYDIDGEFSFEERMGCGFGACMGCSTEVRELDAQGEPTGKYISKRICKEGPVLCRKEILWK